MAEQVLHVSFTPTGQSPIIFEAARDVKVTNSAEVTAEPGTATQVGPRLARRLSCQITCYDMDAESVLRPQMAVAQYRALEALVGTTVTVDARAMPSGILSWVVESVNPGDSNDSNNSFTMEVTAVERIGGASSTSSIIRTGRIQIPRLVTPPNPTPTAPEAPKQPTGVYSGVCVKRSGSTLKINSVTFNGGEVTSPSASLPLIVDADGLVHYPLNTKKAGGSGRRTSGVFTIRRTVPLQADTITEWDGDIYIEPTSGALRFGPGTKKRPNYAAPTKAPGRPTVQSPGFIAVKLLPHILVADAKQLIRKASTKPKSRLAELPKC